MSMSTDLQSTSDAAVPSSTPPSDELPFFRFGLRQLLVFVSLLSLLMAAMATSQGVAALVLLLATLVVALHLFSTALGTQLRRHANAARSHDPPPAGSRIPAERYRASSTHAPPRSPWHIRRSTPLPWLLRWIAAASVLGTVIGALVLGGVIGHRTSPAGIAVGSLSIGVVAGWFAFVGYSFYGVFRHGLRDAVAQERLDQHR